MQLEFPILKRIMFGSDQMVLPEAIGLAVESIQAAEFLSLVSCFLNS